MTFPFRSTARLSTHILILSQTTSPHRILLPLGVIAVRTRCQVCTPLREQNSEREDHPITRFKQGSISFSPLLSADPLFVGTIPLSLLSFTKSLSQSLTTGGAFELIS
ncbi:hypothetical protein DL98DRAFT_65184 [Cadophora sp. DSE1049]|nr:hypothetical protein DL98DRAFT_65184 [Cadophora sp. DSE1049]